MREKVKYHKSLGGSGGGSPDSGSGWRESLTAGQNWKWHGTRLRQDGPQRQVDHVICHVIHHVISLSPRKLTDIGILSCYVHVRYLVGYNLTTSF